MPIPKVSLIERVGCKLRALPAEAFGHVQSSTVICGFNVKKIESVMCGDQSKPYELKGNFVLYASYMSFSVNIDSLTWYSVVPQNFVTVIFLMFSFDVVVHDH